MDSPEEWWHRVEGKRLVAQALKDQRDHAFEAFDACGMAVEFALKGHILKIERLNRWPARDERPELYTHDLDRLMLIAGLRRDHLPSHLRAPLKMVLTWKR